MVTNMCHPPFPPLMILVAEDYQIKKNGHTKCTKFPLFAGFGRGHGRQLYPQFVLEKLIPWLKPMSCCFWWKTLVITPRLDLCQMIIKWIFLFYKFLCKKIYFVFGGLELFVHLVQTHLKTILKLNYIAKPSVTCQKD